MPFDTALSGIRAASADLEITGNNIANASTTGFKSSRAEFGDVYATSVLGAGSNAIGAGVKIEDVSQQFSQGNISFTENALDLAVNGKGFFILSEEGGLTYTRSGAFGVDPEGYVVSNGGARLQGYGTDTAGNIVPQIGDLQIDQNIIDPRQTTAVDQQLNFDATAEVLPSRGQQFMSNGPVIGVAQAGATNGYPAQSIDITNPDGAVLTYTSADDASAAVIAGEMNAVLGLTATASTDATLSNFNNLTSPLTVTVNNVPLNVNSLTELETAVNALTNSTLPGVTASLDPVSGDLSINSSVGSDLVINIAGDAGATLNVAGPAGAAQALVVGGATDTANVGGTLDIIVEDGYIVSNEVPSGTGIFQALGDMTDPANPEFVAVEVNSFNPDDPATYNSATSTTIYDSLGVPHVMTQYFVKQPFNPTDPTAPPNHWEMHVLIDGRDVGNPDPTATDPTAPTRASFDIYFNPNGSLDDQRTSDFLITNWTVYGDDGLPNGALPPNLSGTVPIPEPPISSNFLISVDGSTQFGTPFAVNTVYQNGFTSGQLSGLTVDGGGIVFARFTNGESLALGQVLLADFANQQGLQPIGDTSWAQTFESGDPVINEPGTSSLGAVQSGALEDSNVDLSEQLVNLIIAQRNFQASAKTIETADQTTQTIINLR
ncbi:flagellar hook protein FlgE [Agaribacterium haliotis]|uniref:flagellar hook protein FlgE n=1 Tax=Agaribacterium haliotis TaxID=2013869 RepID=UPI000BB53E01|nr:flagellar hook protein FlgE [Agaribacterium haliotis]